MRSHPHHSDDRYMMVEDEFEAIAKSFTAHLHAAEYDRLRRKARERPPEVKLDTTANMPVTVKQSLARRELQMKQGQALGQVMGHGNVEDGEEGTELNDPWSGTSLAGLMGEGESAKRSLIGLDRLNSSTRAARGFGRGRSGTEKGGDGLGGKTSADISGMIAEDNDNDKTHERPNDKLRLENKLKGEPKRLHEEKNRGSKRLAAQDTLSDFGVPTAISHPRLDKHDTRHDNLESKSRAKIKAATQDSGRSRIRARSYIDNLDDFDESGFDNGPPTTSSPLAKPPVSKHASPSSKQNQRLKEKDRKSRLDEVPLFLV